MTRARTGADVLNDHVTFEVECIDRMYLNVYVPQLQHAGGLLGYVQRHLGLPIASTAPLAKITDRFVAAVHRFAEDEAIPWVDFAKGQRKDDVMHEHLTRFTAAEGVLFIGRAQEKTTLFRTERRRDDEGKSYPWIVKTTGVVNHFYFYCVDADEVVPSSVELRWRPVVRQAATTSSVCTVVPTVPAISASSAARSLARCRWPLIRRNCLPASTMPAAHQRSAICPSRQRLTLAERARQMEIIDSMALVERSVRASVGGTSRRSTVRVSVRPSRRLAAAPGWVLSSSRASALSWASASRAEPAW